VNYKTNYQLLSNRSEPGVLISFVVVELVVTVWHLIEGSIYSPLSIMSMFWCFMTTLQFEYVDFKNSLQFSCYRSISDCRTNPSKDLYLVIHFPFCFSTVSCWDSYDDFFCFSFSMWSFFVIHYLLCDLRILKIIVEFFLFTWKSSLIMAVLWLGTIRIKMYLDDYHKYELNLVWC